MKYVANTSMAKSVTRLQSLKLTVFSDVHFLAKALTPTCEICSHSFRSLFVNEIQFVAKTCMPASVTRQQQDKLIVVDDVQFWAKASMPASMTWRHSRAILRKGFDSRIRDLATVEVQVSEVAATPSECEHTVDEVVRNVVQNEMPPSRRLPLQNLVPVTAYRKGPPPKKLRRMSGISQSVC
jgi:hypothetical protein